MVLCDRFVPPDEEETGTVPGRAIQAGEWFRAAAERIHHPAEGDIREAVAGNQMNWLT